MSLIDTREIATAKIVMVGARGGAESLNDLSDVSLYNSSNGQVLTFNSVTGKWENQNPSGGSGYAGLGIGKKKTVTNNVIDTDIDLHRAPIVGDRLLIYFDEKVTNPTGLTTYNNGTAVTSGLESVTPMYINAGWNILKYESNLLNTGWVRVQNVPVPSTLAGMSDTLIVSPSDGQMLVYDNNVWKNKTAVQANPTGTAVRELKKIQIGDNVFDTFGLKTFDVSSVTSGVSGAIAVDVITASQLNGEIIVIHTGSNTGSTGNAWTLALSDAQTVEALTMSKADGTAFTEALTANSLMFVKINTSNDTAVVLGIVGAGSDVSGNSSGSPVAYLNKLKIGSAIYDTSAIRPFSVSQIANNTVKIFVADINQLGGKVIALSTGALTGTTSSAWSLNLVDTSGGAVSLSVDMLNADGTAFADDISSNELLFVAIDLTNYEGTILSVVGKSEDEIKTATGNPVTLTDAIAGNAIEVSAEIVASQDLHGYDKPWVGGAGKNKLDFKAALDYWGATYTDNGDGSYTVTAIGDSYTNPYEFLDTAAAVSISVASIEALQYAVNWRIQIYDETNGRWEDITSESLKYENITAKKIRLNYSTQGLGIIVSDLQIELGSTATTYEPYENICPITGFSSVTITDVDAQEQTATVTVALGQTVYGGTLDLTSGEMTITHANIASYNGETIGVPWISSLDEYTQGGTPTTGAQVVYTLATPTTTTLTPAQLALVKGYNQLSCNSGDMSITYKASGLDALKERVDELEDRVDDVETELASKTENSVVGTVENGTTASQPYAVGEHFIRNDKFCTAIATIASGATLTQGTNYVEGTIAEALNEVSSVGGIPYISDMPSFTMSATDRFTRVAGGWISKGNKTYVNILLKLAYSIPAYTQNPYEGEYDTRISYDLPAPYAKMSNKLDVSWGQKNAYNSYLMIAEGVGHIAVGNNGKAYIAVGASVALNGTSNDIYCLIRGEYDNQ